jgi:hypothetical protein
MLWGLSPEGQAINIRQDVLLHSYIGFSASFGDQFGFLDHDIVRNTFAHIVDSKGSN